MEMLTDGNGWLALGIVLIILEMALGTGYVLISFGIGSILTGLAEKLNLLPSIVVDIIDQGIVMGIISIIALVALRRIFNKPGDTDINEY